VTRSTRRSKRSSPWRRSSLPGKPHGPPSRSPRSARRSRSSLSPVPEVPAASGEAPAPTVGLFDPLPAPARRLAKNGSTTTSCERCGNPVQQQPRGARRKFCSDDCRLRTKTERTARREADPGLELLPDRVERPFSAFAHPDDDRSDPALLRPPPMSWEREGGAGRGRPIRGLHGPARVA
jgi:hypothetical protein